MTPNEVEALQRIGRTLLDLPEDRVQSLIDRGTITQEWWRDE